MNVWSWESSLWFPSLNSDMPCRAAALTAQVSLSTPQMSCWSSSGGVRDGGKSRNVPVQFIAQNGNPNTAWATQGGSQRLLGHKQSDWPLGHCQMYGPGPWATPWAHWAEPWQHYKLPFERSLKLQKENERNISSSDQKSSLVWLISPLGV